MIEQPNTIGAALAWAAARLADAGPTPRLDAELLLAHTLGWPRARLLAERRAVLGADGLRAFELLVERRRALEPVAYLTGHKEFFGRDFLVDSRVLVPRPETELLVELALERTRTKNQEPGTARHQSGSGSRFSVLGSPLVIADIGTGSGCIAVTLALELPAAELLAVDIAPGALEVARANAERHGVVGRVRLLHGDLLGPLGAPVDLLVSNPPYTVLAAIDENVRRHEPQLALDGGPDGLDLYRQLLAGAPACLRPGGSLLLEIGADQAAAVAALARAAFPAGQIGVHRDLAGLDRVLTLDT